MALKSAYSDKKVLRNMIFVTLTLYDQSAPALESNPGFCKIQNFGTSFCSVFQNMYLVFILYQTV